MPVPSSLQLDRGDHIFKSASIYGSRGPGTPKALAAFEPPDTFPDFSGRQTTPQTKVARQDPIVHGAPFRGFAEIMPAFGDALSADS